ncbi:hypothetical protein ART_2346 [Arthrobacter sp. PAMC 25486]|nr:hypothetical protein ART_2346 [Arthrobacter sp. PAMC 25486]
MGELVNAKRAPLKRMRDRVSTWSPESAAVVVTLAVHA